MIRSLIIPCGVLALLMAPGCGQKGPLYLPPAQTESASDSESKSDPDPQPKADSEKPE
ncbi:MAG: lipoprotein [Sedimenticolaceae bacterium]